MTRLTRLLFPLIVAFAHQANGWAEARSAIFVLGPMAEQSASSTVRASAAAARQLLDAGVGVKLWIPGTRDPQLLTKFLKPQDLEKSFADAAATASSNRLPSLLNDLDRATFALRREAGKRLLIAVLNSPDLKSGDAESRLASTADFCKENAIQVVFVSAAPSDAGALQSLAEQSGGSVQDPSALAAALISTFPPDGNAVVGKTAESAAASAGVRVRVIRTLPAKSKGNGKELAPMLGLLMVEAPLASLEFQENGKTYAARARVSAVVRNRSDKAVFQVKKEIAIKTSVAKLSARKSGNLCFMRGVSLPGGAYTVDATVEDLESGKKQIASEDIKAEDSLPGFDVSDALLVRKDDESVDRFESDDILAFNGVALAPILNPTFAPHREFDLQVYFIIYPDYRGAIPEMELDIVRDGQSVAHSKLNFTESIRNTATEGGVFDPKGEQKSEFPYLATLPGVSLDPGKYEVRVTVRQGSISVKRSAAFAVGAS